HQDELIALALELGFHLRRLGDGVQRVVRVGQRLLDEMADRRIVVENEDLHLAYALETFAFAAGLGLVCLRLGQRVHGGVRCAGPLLCVHFHGSVPLHGQSGWRAGLYRQPSSRVATADTPERRFARARTTCESLRDGRAKYGKRWPSPGRG